MRTPAERLVVADLRKYSASAVEDDLGLELGPAESQRDEAGMVAAISNGLRIIATIRFVPSGQGLTGAERLKDGVGPDSRFLGPGGWEVGRLIVAPEDRDPELLSRCLALGADRVGQIERGASLLRHRDALHGQAVASLRYAHRHTDARRQRSTLHPGLRRGRRRRAQPGGTSTDNPSSSRFDDIRVSLLQ